MAGRPRRLGKALQCCLLGSMIGLQVRSTIIPKIYNGGSILWCALLGPAINISHSTVGKLTIQAAGITIGTLASQESYYSQAGLQDVSRIPFRYNPCFKTTHPTLIDGSATIWSYSRRGRLAYNFVYATILRGSSSRSKDHWIQDLRRILHFSNSGFRSLQSYGLVSEENKTKVNVLIEFPVSINGNFSSYKLNSQSCEYFQITPQPTHQRYLVFYQPIHLCLILQRGSRPS